MPGGHTTAFLGQWLFAALSRGVLLSIGMFSVWWGASTFPIFWSDARLDHTADGIINGEEYKREILQTLLDDAEFGKEPGPVRTLSEARRSFGLALPNRLAMLKVPSLPTLKVASLPTLKVPSSPVPSSSN